MKSESGGFYSALDADSERPDKPGEHAEGAYYLWHESELKKLLSKAEFLFIKEYFSIKTNGNIDSDPQNEFRDLNILAIDEEYRDKDLTEKQTQLLSSAKKKLNNQRLLRPRPHLDDKVITAWNGMMISAFAKAAITFDEALFLEEAINSARFIKKHLYLAGTNAGTKANSKKLYRQYRANQASSAATLADYVWLINGLIDIYHARADKEWLNWALELQRLQDELFLDEASGAYFESVAGDTSLLFRSKNIYDNAIPSANAIALANLRSLSSLVINASQKNAFSTKADKLVKSFAGVVNQNPAAAASLLAVEIKHQN